MDLSTYPIDHIGIAVKSIDASMVFYKNLFNASISKREKLLDQNVEVAFIDLPNIKLELISPIDNSGAVYNFLSKRGEGLHHICYKVSNVQDMLDHCQKIGVVVIDKQPRQGAFGKLIGFAHPKSCGGVLVEFCQ